MQEKIQHLTSFLDELAALTNKYGYAIVWDYRGCALDDLIAQCPKAYDLIYDEDTRTYSNPYKQP